MARNSFSVDEYLALPYTIEVLRDDSDGEVGYVARVVELPGCLTQADDFTELGEMVEDAMRAWIETALEDGYPIPEPRSVDEYSGRFVARLPKSLHRDLAAAAERDGVSLNALVNVALAKYIGGDDRTDDDAAGTDIEPIDRFVPHWPHLSESACIAMRADGLDVEVREVDEQMFADWLMNQVMQIDAGMTRSSRTDIDDHLGQFIQALNIIRRKSLVVDAMYKFARLFERLHKESSDSAASYAMNEAATSEIARALLAQQQDVVPGRRYETTASRVSQPYHENKPTKTVEDEFSELVNRRRS